MLCIHFHNLLISHTILMYVKCTKYYSIAKGMTPFTGKGRFWTKKVSTYESDDLHSYC